MYYDRETQRKYIRRLIFSVGAFILSSVLAIVLVHNANSKQQDQIVIQDKAISTPQTTENIEKLYKVVSVTDGDTINIDYNGTTKPLRLIGVDTPETVDSRVDVQCYGPEASNYLKNLLSGKMVSIEADSTQDNTDKYDRLLRYIYLNNEDVGLKIIRNGYGKEYTYNLPYKKQSEYKAAEDSAKKEKLGMWNTKNCKDTDSDNGQTTTIVVETPKSCLIKGNISTNTGERIYHVPGQRYYNETKIDTSKGERWFCSEAEAKAAGWRKSKV